MKRIGLALARMAAGLGMPWTALTVDVADSIQAAHPCFVVVPQCPKDSQWVNTPWSKGSYDMDGVAISEPMKSVVGILDSLEREFNIDKNHAYLSGISMGGFGAWHIASRYPDRFAPALQAVGSAVRHTEYPKALGINHGSWVPAGKTPELAPWVLGQAKVSVALASREGANQGKRPVPTNGKMALVHIDAVGKIHSTDNPSKAGFSRPAP